MAPDSAASESQQIADWLAAHPDFFNAHPRLLTELDVPHPHGTHTVSLAERQLIAMRERVRQIESRHAELLRFGEENDAISAKLHELACALMKCATRVDIAAELALHLAERFAVPHHVLRVWAWDPPAEPIVATLAALGKPACGALALDAASDWFGEVSPHLRSFATIPLAAGADAAPLGVLVLASEEDQRFYSGMGTLYLERLGQLLAACLARVAA